MEASTPFSNIPIEIIRLILLQLSVKSVIRCQSVCKQWLLLIEDSDFKLSYPGQRRVIFFLLEPKSRYYYGNSSRVDVRSAGYDLRLQRHKRPFGGAYSWIRASDKDCVRLCSCNGLVLVVTERDILLWNPSTRCSTKVLEWPYPEQSKRVILTGLCYDPCTRDYKAVLLLCSHPFVISVSLNRKEWRPVEFPYSLLCVGGGVDFRNTFHWWVSDIRYRDRDFSSGNRIVYFDPAHDEFRILPTPKLRHGRENSIVGLGVIDDCFCMACIVQVEEPKAKIKMIQVLIMKEYDRIESWMTAFSIQMPEHPDIYGSYGFTLTFYSLKKNAQEVLFLRKGKGVECLYIYDRKKDELKEVLLDFQALTFYRRDIASMCFYVESLACPGHNGLLSL
ncbi:PREDICTED: F-box protein CPR30-like [Ipomoea nil]|uniref:F-box protein CPR30-like n=1 Tax=Ipomoea nil TaxID=35883 RepID=UPI0009015AFB|nr:PREDICTED: F-box protein CPR30-like [Ipomoea nil]